ncbi:MAG: DUF2110 family protein, partial [Candidatus Korarchaeota archaeon]|nr:DUF2110 family protein [Candidatus Korarchaeota archaeon]NIU85558.1 DUF2110 family protein [Candidatus Thorarchaeota archaeon]
MPTITLSTKVDDDHQLLMVRNFLKPIFTGLKVKTKIDTTPRGWVQVTVSGEDQDVLLNYLAQKVGVSP